MHSGRFRLVQYFPGYMILGNAEDNALGRTNQYFPAHFSVSEPLLFLQSGKRRI
jgi:hypothetical protein